MTRALAIAFLVAGCSGHIATDAYRDPDATKLCAALSHVTSAIEILKPGDAHQQTGERVSPAGDSNE